MEHIIMPHCFCELSNLTVKEYKRVNKYINHQSESPGLVVWCMTGMLPH
jgi:hypothetical protein